MPPSNGSSGGASEEERGARPAPAHARQAPPASPAAWPPTRAKLAAGALLVYVVLTYVIAVVRTAPPPSPPTAAQAAAAGADDDSDADAVVGAAAAAAVPRTPTPYRAPTAPAVLLTAAGGVGPAAAAAGVLSSVMTFLPRDAHPPPAGCAATRGGVRLHPGERPFDSLLLVNVDSRMSRQLHGPLEACAAGVCVGTWRPMAGRGAHVLLLGDEEVTGVRRKWRFTIKNEEVHGLLTREAGAVGGLTSPGGSSTLVVVLDGTDVLLQANPAELIARFNQRWVALLWWRAGRLGAVCTLLSSVDCEHSPARSSRPLLPTAAASASAGGTQAVTCSSPASARSGLTSSR
jgi:hypothetical protein